MSVKWITKRDKNGKIIRYSIPWYDYDYYGYFSGDPGQSAGTSSVTGSGGGGGPVFPEGGIVFYSGSLTGSGDTFEGYAVENPVTSTLNSAGLWATPWELCTVYYGLQAQDLFDSYTAGPFLNGVNNGGVGFSGSWAVN